MAIILCLLLVTWQYRVYLFENKKIVWVYLVKSYVNLKYYHDPGAHRLRHFPYLFIWGWVLFGNTYFIFSPYLNHPLIWTLANYPQKTMVDFSSTAWIYEYWTEIFKEEVIDRSIPVNNSLLTGSVPVNNSLLTGALKKLSFKKFPPPPHSPH